MQNAGLDEAQAVILISRRSIKNLRFTDDTTLMGENTEEQEPLDENERGEWKCWLKTHHEKNQDHGMWSHHFMANWWGNNRKSDRLYFLGLQNHCRWWCSHEIKRQLLPGIKAMMNLDSILKSRDITLPTKVRQVNSMVFPIVMYGCEIWTIKKAEHRTFELWCWRTLLRVPWTARSNQATRKEVHPDYFLEGLMLKLKLQYFGHHRRMDSLEKTLMLGKIEGRRRRGWQRMRWLDGITN